MTKKKETPLMKQYNSMKRKHPDALLLFRVGDFYETFGNDAIKASKILDIVLTKRANGSASHIELAGFPYHALNNYLPKLVKAGNRVAICEQLEDPKKTKTIVKRGITELITPGVSLNDELLAAKENNFLCALHFAKSCIGVAFVDISTGKFFVGQESSESIKKIVESFAPSEIIFQKQFKNTYSELFKENYYTYRLDDWVFEYTTSYKRLITQFNTSSLKGFGVEDLSEGIIAAGACLYYLSDTRHNELKHIVSIRKIASKEYLWMDDFTIRNLELFYSPNSQSTSLLSVIDASITSLGGRLLKRWVALPLKNKDDIDYRLNKVESFTKNNDLCQKIRVLLKSIGDLERLSSKIGTKRISPREMRMILQSMEHTLDISKRVEQSGIDTLIELTGNIDPCRDLLESVKKTIVEEPPQILGKGFTIANGVSEELDEWKSLLTSGKSHLDSMQQNLIKITGISSLKIGFNNVFGYYIEVRNTHKEKVPESWIRKQTLVSAERYITEELKEYESKILMAESKILELETIIFSNLIDKSIAYIPSILKNAEIVAKIDCLLGFSVVANKRNYIKPIINNGYDIEIEDGRHPVIEQNLPLGEAYISNTIEIKPESQQIMMITGPNMSGKSAVLRQTALIVLLAQIGCFVPARAANIGVIDKIFTRVGASDNISKGESTFMVEMIETASILNNLSQRSLLLLDEIGRGTSTYDGISIAWAVAEFLHEHPLRPKTLFATHYHELNNMSNDYSRIKNFHIGVKEHNEKVIFLRKLLEGGSEHSFGIHVAKMAGLPRRVLKKAKTLLKKMEESKNSESIKSQLVKHQQAENVQLSIFQLDDPTLESIRDVLLSVDVNQLTPIEALLKLGEIKRMIEP